MRFLVLFFVMIGFSGCMREVPVIILEYPPRVFETMDSVRLEQRITRHMSGRVEHLFYVYEDSLGNELQHGPDILYYLDGLKKQVQYYRKGKLWGLATYWYNSGQKQGFSLYAEGKPHGVAKTWNKEGRLVSEKYWKKGKLHGPQTEYDDQGKVKMRKWWVENKLVPAPVTPIDTVMHPALDTMSVVQDTLPVLMPDSTMPPANPSFFSGE